MKFAAVTDEEVRRRGGKSDLSKATQLVPYKTQTKRSRSSKYYTGI